jgi:hypothetical protein
MKIFYFFQIYPAPPLSWSFYIFSWRYFFTFSLVYSSNVYYFFVGQSYRAKIEKKNYQRHLKLMPNTGKKQGCFFQNHLPGEIVDITGLHERNPHIPIVTFIT